jgi:hypothetical protein
MQKNDITFSKMAWLFIQLSICWIVAILALIALDMKSKFGIWALTAETLELRNDIDQSTIPWLHGMPFFFILLTVLIYAFRRFGQPGEFGWFAKCSIVTLAAILMEMLRMSVYGNSIRLLLHTMLTVGLSLPLIYVTHQISLWYVRTSTDARGWLFDPRLLKGVGGLVLFTSLGSGYFLLMRAIDTECIKKTGLSCVEEDKSSRIEDLYMPSSQSAKDPTDRPLQTSFTLEKLDQHISNIIGDIDGNGSVDFVNFNNLKPTFILNSKGILQTTDFGLAHYLNFPVAQLVLADLNHDGLDDILAVRRNYDLGLLYRYIRDSAFMPVADEQFSIKILLQTSRGVWRDATGEMFKSKLPLGFLKVEPIIFADLNHDGWLDFIWQQYPHRLLGSQNAVYVRGEDGRYVDKMAELMDSKHSMIMPEGADYADVNGDGEIDLFAFGYPNIAKNGKFYRICGKQYANMPCEVSRRLEEGATFFDLGGTPHLALSYWGTEEIFPHKALYFFKANADGSFTPIKNKSQGVFRGINTYLVAKDLDLNGTEALLTTQPARLLVWYKDRYWDALPGIVPELAGKKIEPVGLVDFDDDGDIDILLNVAGEPNTYLLRNNLNPKSFVRISTKSSEGIDNQFGATLTFKSEDKKDNWWRVYRPRGGYGGSTDSRIIVKPRINQNYSIRACYPSISPLEVTKPYLSSAISLQITGSLKNCITYQLTVLKDDAKINLKLLAGGHGFKIE